MAFDNGSAKSAASYRCSFEKCGVRFTAAAGYFDTFDKLGKQEFLAHIDAVACNNAPDHHVYILGYAKEAWGDHTEEWRQWHCSTEGCKFSLRQKLSVSQNSAQQQPVHTERRQHERIRLG